MAVVPWVQPFPTGWQQSTDGGATWGTAPAPTTSNQVAGPRGTQRFRTEFTIPANVSGTWFVTVSGDIYDGTVNDPAELLYDGVSQGTVTPLAGPRTYTLAVVPGAHTLTLLIGAADDSGLATIPTVTFSFNNVVETSAVPCDCCPTDSPPMTATTQVRFTEAAQTVAEAGWTPQGLNQTADGITNNANVTGYNSPGGLVTSSTLRVAYTMSLAQDRVRGLRLWNQTGAVLNDSDGIGNVITEFYAGATLLATQPFTGVNGGVPQDFLLPGSMELDSVDQVVLRNIGKLSSATVAPTWRELQLLVVRDVWACRRANGTLEWYDQDGQLVPQSALNFQQLTTPLPDLRFTGAFFGDGPDPAGENICFVSPTPSATTGFAAPVDGCYDPTAGNPTIDWVLPSAVELEYGNLPHTSGGVNISFSSPALGASITWPTNGASMNPGEQRTSNIFAGNRRAVLTYVSGPLATAPSQTIRMMGGATLGVHLGTTDNTTPAIRFRLEFYTV
ncbi:hypothetical protein SEA_XKCD426_19 [Streptomyces phage Xkcd426]|nr:hypothetical protein SEA_XKCD426_19 [Streptomyces phage Xkcd426]